MSTIGALIFAPATVPLVIFGGATVLISAVFNEARAGEAIGLKEEQNTLLLASQAESRKALTELKTVIEKL